MAWTQAHLDALKEARARGLREIHYADKGLSYMGAEELARLQAEIEQDLASQAGQSGQRTTYGTFSRG